MKLKTGDYKRASSTKVPMCCIAANEPKNRTIKSKKAHGAPCLIPLKLLVTKFYGSLQRTIT